jgi:hypothetical protein
MRHDRVCCPSKVKLFPDEPFGHLELGRVLHGEDKRACAANDVAPASPWRGFPMHEDWFTRRGIRRGNVSRQDAIGRVEDTDVLVREYLVSDRCKGRLRIVRLGSIHGHHFKERYCMHRGYTAPPPFPE